MNGLRESKNTLAFDRIKLVAVVVLTVLFVFFVYTFLHETGHVLAGLAFGQSLTEFDLSFWDFSAHVGMVGSLTEPQVAIQSAAGASLPLIVWAIFISLVPRRANFSLETLKLVASMAVVNTLLVWIIIPVLYLRGAAPPDDVTSFLYYSQLPPLVVSTAAAALYAAGWALFLAKTGGLRDEFRLFSQSDPGALSTGAHPVFSGMAAVTLVLIFVTLIANRSAHLNPDAKIEPPPGFQLASQVDLDTRPYEGEALASFSLAEPTFAGIFIVIEDINTTYFDLSLAGPDGFSATILHGEGYRAEKDGGLWEQFLPPGEYHLVLTSDRSPGRAKIYWNIDQ